VRVTNNLQQLLGVAKTTGQQVSRESPTNEFKFAVEIIHWLAFLIIQNISYLVIRCNANTA